MKKQIRNICSCYTLQAVNTTHLRVRSFGENKDERDVRDWDLVNFLRLLVLLVALKALFKCKGEIAYTSTRKFLVQFSDAVFRWFDVKLT